MAGNGSTSGHVRGHHVRPGVSALRRFVAECKGSAVPELHRLARTALRWRIPILVHHLAGASNGPTESVNLVVKRVQRVAHAFRSFRNYRLQVLLLRRRMADSAYRTKQRPLPPLVA